MSDWKPIKSAPFQEVIEVRNPQMDRPCLATRGYTHNGMVHPNTEFCTSVFTPDPNGFSFPAGRLVCPTEWRPSASVHESAKDAQQSPAGEKG
jgi:hypothetical protein